MERWGWKNKTSKPHVVFAFVEDVGTGDVNSVWNETSKFLAEVNHVWHQDQQDQIQSNHHSGKLKAASVNLK